MKKRVFVSSSLLLWICLQDCGVVTGWRAITTERNPIRTKKKLSFWWNFVLMGRRRQNTYLSSNSIVVYVDKMSFWGSLLVPWSVSEPLAEDDTETDVISTSSPLELARRRFIRQRAAAAFRRRPGTACLGDRLRQCGRRQSVHVRLLSTPCNSKV